MVFVKLGIIVLVVLVIAATVVRRVQVQIPLPRLPGSSGRSGWGVGDQQESIC
jgi:hypothetical protein